MPLLAGKVVFEGRFGFITRVESTRNNGVPHFFVFEDASPTDLKMKAGVFKKTFGEAMDVFNERLLDETEDDVHNNSIRA